MKRLILLLALLLPLPALAGTVTLAWDANTEPTVTGYKIHIGTASRSYTRIENTGNVTTYAVSNLAPGKWYFSATAYDAAGNESGFSNEVSTVVTAAILPVTIQITQIPAPGPRVTLLLATYISTTQATIVWQTDVDCSGTAWWSTDQIAWKSGKANNLGTTDHLYAIGGLAPRTHYFYRVTGTCGVTAITSDTRSLNTK